MNKRTAYEIIIAEKAGQQPLPDMADAIWASVSAGLDALPPSTGGSSGGAVTSAAKGISAWHFVLYGAGIAVFVTAAVFFWKKQSGRPLPQQQPHRTAPVQPPLQENRHTDSGKLKPSGIPFAPSKDEKPKVIDSPRRISDTQLIDRMPGAIRVTPPHIPSLVAPDTASVNLPAKKPHGVKGLSDSDYKIVPTGRDSLPPGKRQN